MSIRRRVAASKLARLIAFPLRCRVVMKHLTSEAQRAIVWLRTSRETTNYNYDLSELNKTHLAWWVAELCGVPYDRVLDYFAELENDEFLARHIHDTTLSSAFWRVSDASPPYGRRLAWYALVRILQPECIVETGIDKGLGTCVLAAAVLRNGHGRILAVDITPGSGWLVSGSYAPVVELSIGDAAEAIASLTEPISMLIHDVHFTPEQELSEYQAASSKLMNGAVVLNDNAHRFDVLPNLAAIEGWRYLHFQERPIDHWYPGAALGAAVVTRSE